MKFKTDDGAFDVERFKAAVRVFITAQEIIVDNASYPIKEIAENSHIFRTLGLGYANLGSLIMSYGFGYDSVEGRALCGAITAIMTGEAYERSARHGCRRWGRSRVIATRVASGVPKPVAKDNVAPMLDVIEQHRCAVREIPDNEEFGYLKEEAARVLGPRAELGQEARLSQRAGHRPRADRHDQLPDGLRHHRHRARHRAGEIQAARRRRHVEDRQPDGRPALEKLGYNSEEIERIIAHIEEFDTIEDVPKQTARRFQRGLKPEHLPIFDCAFKPLQRRAQSSVTWRICG